MYVLAMLSLMAGSMVMASVRLGGVSRGRWMYDAVDDVYVGGGWTEIEFVIAEDGCREIRVWSVPSGTEMKNVSFVDGLGAVTGNFVGSPDGFVGTVMGGAGRVLATLGWSGGGVGINVTVCGGVVVGFRTTTGTGTTVGVFVGTLGGTLLGTVLVVWMGGYKKGMG